VSLDVKQLAETMIGAAGEAVSDRWPQMQALAEVELRRLAQSIEDLGRLVAAGKIDEAKARHHAHMHQLMARSVLTTVEGLGLLTAEQATQAAIRSVTAVVNRTLKFVLL
jgi:hypothetical protein